MMVGVVKMGVSDAAIVSAAISTNLIWHCTSVQWKADCKLVKHACSDGDLNTDCV